MRPSASSSSPRFRNLRAVARDAASSTGTVGGGTGAGLVAALAVASFSDDGGASTTFGACCFVSLGADALGGPLDGAGGAGGAAVFGATSLALATTTGGASAATRWCWTSNA